MLLMLFTPGILGIPTPDMETNGFEDESLITDDVLQANESSVDISNGVSAKLLCIHSDMYIYS